MPAIFISHASVDGKAADDVKAVLGRLGFERIFLDFDKRDGIGLGENWEKRLYEELTRCHAVVLVLTPNWLASKWCFVELAQARALGKVILPILCEPLGDHRVLPEVQATDIVDWNGGGVERLERRLRAITDELARGFTLDPNRSPYPGIHAFEAEDAAIYFGRDDETRTIIEKLDARRRQGGARLVVIVGASGSGKSSLLRAGVLPQLGRRRSQWIVMPPMRPEKAPLEALAKTFAGLSETSPAPRPWRTWHERLRTPDAAGYVGDLIKDLRVGEARGATLLLPVDQFEEVFTIANAGERDAFLALLATLLDPGRDLPVLAVATGRADVLDGLLDGSQLAPLSETIPLPRMPLDRVPRLVEGPATVAGLFIEKGLSERITRDVASPDALPLLAHMLRLLHERGSRDRRLTIAEYNALGDPIRGLNPVQNSVRLAADLAIESVKPRGQELAALRDAFVPHLVRLRLDDAARVRQPAAMTALPQESLRLIRALIDARLLSAHVIDGEAVVEVAHEALFAAWPTLANWLDEEQAFLADIERIKSAYDVWAQTPDGQKPHALLQGLLLGRARDWLLQHPGRFLGRSTEPLRAFIATSAAAADAERARGERLRRRFTQTVAAAAVVFALAAGVAGWQYLDAESARQTAVTAEARAVAEQRRAERNFEVAKQAADDVVFQLAQDLRNVQGMRIESVRKILDAAKALMDQLARAAPDDLELQRSRSAMLNEFTETYIGTGDLTRARTAADESLTISRKVAAVDPNNARWQRDVFVSLNKVGNVRFAAGDRAGALAAYEECLTIMRKLAAAEPENAARQRDIAISLDRIGDVHRISGDNARALAAYQESIAITRNLAATNPDNPALQSDLVISLSKIGNVRRATGDRSGALAAYEESLAIMRKLAAADPQNTDWQRDLSASLDKVGDMRLAAGDRAGALGLYEESLAIMRRLAATDPGNAMWQRDLSISIDNVGDVRVAIGDRAGALTLYEESLAIRRRLAAADPANPGWQADLALSLFKVSTAADVTRARSVLREALAILRSLEREGKLTAAQRQWPTVVENALAKLPPETTRAR